MSSITKYGVYEFIQNLPEIKRKLMITTYANNLEMALQLRDIVYNIYINKSDRYYDEIRRNNYSIQYLKEKVIIRPDEIKKIKSITYTNSFTVEFYDATNHDDMLTNHGRRLNNRKVSLSTYDTSTGKNTLVDEFVLDLKKNPIDKDIINDTYDEDVDNDISELHSNNTNAVYNDIKNYRDEFFKKNPITNLPYAHDIVKLVCDEENLSNKYLKQLNNQYKFDMNLVDTKISKLYSEVQDFIRKSKDKRDKFSRFLEEEEYIKN